MDPALAGSWVSSRPDSEAKLRIDSRRRVSASTIVAQNIPGHWSGGTDGPQLTLDLAADGSGSAMYLK
jgi:hypothetical protein